MHLFNTWENIAKDQYLNDEKNLSFAVNYINKDKIKYYIKPSKFIEAEAFQPLVDFINKFFPRDTHEKLYKAIYNCFIGSLNTKYNKIDIGGITTDKQTAYAIMYEEIMKDRTPTLVEEQGNFFIRSRKEERKEFMVIHIKLYK